MAVVLDLKGTAESTFKRKPDVEFTWFLLAPYVKILCLELAPQFIGFTSNFRCFLGDTVHFVNNEFLESLL